MRGLILAASCMLAATSATAADAADPFPPVNDQQLCSGREVMEVGAERIGKPDEPRITAQRVAVISCVARGRIFEMQVEACHLRGEQETCELTSSETFFYVYSIKPILHPAGTRITVTAQAARKGQQTGDKYRLRYFFKFRP